MNTQGFDFTQILNCLYRRKEIAIAVFLVVSVLAAHLAVSLPDVYRSSTLILVTPQRLPATYVTSTVTSTIEQRMKAIAQQVLGRTMLERVVNEFDLFNHAGAPASIEQRVGMLRRRINLEIGRSETFSLSFDADTPENAQRVTARIASLFIEENLKVREQQAAGTTNFISAEAERLRKELELQEARVNKFRGQYWSELPETRETNLKTVDQLQRELENGVNRLALLQDRKAALEKQLAESDQLEKEIAMLGNLGSQSVSELTPQARRKLELEALLKKYSPKHPDVIRLKRELEAGEAEVPTKDAKPTQELPLRTHRSLKVTLATQIDELRAEMAVLQTKNKNIRDQVTTLQSRLDNTPQRAIELSKITRDYDITLKKYQDLLAKALDSELSENMEKKQKGEQFQIVDPASLPVAPAAPNRLRILLSGLALGLGGGIGLALLLDKLSKSFQTKEELAAYGIPVLAVLPAVSTRGSILQYRKQLAAVFVLSCGALAAGLIVIRLIGHLLPIR
jgi:polysaccharide chain length determinant protein (PEP-CTERM system associated)